MTYLKKLSRGAAVGTIALLLLAGTPALAADNPQVAAEVMALARAQWASEIAGAPIAQQNVSLADDYTEFNGDFPTLLVGKATSTGMGEVTPYDKAMYSDMQNSRVQVYGDTAILTYNFTGLRRGADGRSRRRWPSRRGFMRGWAARGSWSTPISRRWLPGIKSMRAAP